MEIQKNITREDNSDTIFAWCMGNDPLKGENFLWSQAGEVNINSFISNDYVLINRGGK